MDKIWDRKSFEVGGHRSLWRGWKHRMTTQNRQRSNAKKTTKKKRNPNQRPFSYRFERSSPRKKLNMYKKLAVPLPHSLRDLHPHGSSSQQKPSPSLFITSHPSRPSVNGNNYYIHVSLINTTLSRQIKSVLNSELVLILRRNSIQFNELFGTQYRCFLIADRLNIWIEVVDSRNHAPPSWMVQREANMWSHKHKESIIMLLSD